MGVQMKNPIRDFLIIFIFVNLAWLCVRPAHAVGTAVVPYNSKVTPGNPMGYSASVDGGGNVKMSTELMVIPQPAPAGQPVSAGLTALATAAGGGAVIAPEGTFQAVLNNPAGAIGMAATYMTLGGAFAMPFNPAVGGALLIGAVALQTGLSTCNFVGCHFLDGLKTQGIEVAADGAVNKVTAATGSVQVLATGSSGYGISLGQQYGTRPTPAQVCSTLANCPVGYAGTFVPPNICNNYPAASCAGVTYTIVPYGSLSCPSGYTLSGNICSGGSGSPATSQPASNADVVAAIAAASASANFKADMVNLGLQNGMAMVAEAQTAQSVQVASAFSQLSSVTDVLGNTVQTLARNVSTVAPGANSSLPPVVTNSVQQVTITNAVPTATTSTTIVDPAAAAVAATTGQTPTQDMCLQHPDILACADISKLNDLPSVTPLTAEKNISSISPVSLGAGFAICPPPLVLPGMSGSPSITIDLWRWPCRFADKIKPINIAAAGMASIFILMGAFRGNNG